jgi:hypothetical protein
MTQDSTSEPPNQVQGQTQQQAQQQQAYQSKTDSSPALRIGFSTEIQLTADDKRHTIAIDSLIIPWRFILYKPFPLTSLKYKTACISYPEVHWSKEETNAAEALSDISDSPSIQEVSLFLAASSLLRVMARAEDTHGVILHGIPLTPRHDYVHQQIRSNGYRQIFSANPKEYTNYLGQL